MQEGLGSVLMQVSARTYTNLMLYIYLQYVYAPVYICFLYKDLVRTSSKSRW
jgi:hypothetical protein